MLVTLLGIVTLVRPVQPSNAPSPMLVTLLPIVTPAKGCSLKERIFSDVGYALPIVTTVNLVQFQNA